MVESHPYHLLYQSLDRPLSGVEMDQILEAIRSHPQFGLLHLLKAKGNPTPENIFEASLYTTDRKLLRRYLENKIYFPPPHAPLSANMDESASQPSQNPQLFSILDYDQLPAYVPKPEMIFQMVGADTPVHHQLDAMIREQVLRHIGLGEEIREQLGKYLQKDRSEALIDQFLAAPPKTPRRRMQPETTDKAHDPETESIEADEELVTETLAKLYLRQNNPAEAIRIYQKLSLRFPEKSAYFDAQILKINIE